MYYKLVNIIHPKYNLSILYIVFNLFLMIFKWNKLVFYIFNLVWCDFNWGCYIYNTSDSLLSFVFCFIPYIAWRVNSNNKDIHKTTHARTHTEWKEITSVLLRYWLTAKGKAAPYLISDMQISRLSMPPSAGGKGKKLFSKREALQSLNGVKVTVHPNTNGTCEGLLTDWETSAKIQDTRRQTRAVKVSFRFNFCSRYEMLPRMPAG